MMSASYGLILICNRKRSTLIVQRKYSPMFLHLIRGYYKPADLSVILSSISSTEYAFIQKLCVDISTGMTLLIDKLEVIYGIDKARKLAARAINSLRDNYNSIVSILPGIVTHNECDWLWPKGRPDKDEDELSCAIRETFEESSVKLSRDMIGDLPPIHISFTTFFGLNINITYRVAIVEDEISLNGHFDAAEIAAVKWVSFEEASLLLSSEYAAILASLLVDLNI